MSDSIAGLDLSTRAAAAVAVPQNWDGKWSRLKTLVAGEDLGRGATDRERALRTEHIAKKLVTFMQRNGVVEVWIEGYAFRQNQSAHTLAELGGVVRLELVRAGIEVRTAMMQTARKLLLGKLPPRRKKGETKEKGASAKDVVEATLKAAGAAFATLDECDAFVCANLGLSERGGFFYGQYEPKAPRKSRKAAAA